MSVVSVTNIRYALTVEVKWLKTCGVSDGQASRRNLPICFNGRPCQGRPFHAIAVILDDRLFFAGDGLDLPGGGNLDPGLDHVGDRRQERVRRHGRLLLCGEQHL